MTDIQPHTPNPAAEVTAWDLLQRQANILADSSIVPRQYQGRPGDIVAAAMMGREVGWQPMTSLQLIHVVEGKPEISAQGMAALIRRAGHSLTGELTLDAATVTGKRGDNGDTMTFTFTMEDANRASLAGKGNWKKYPLSMLWARAVSQLARMLFPDVVLGVSYVEGEISGADLAELGEPVVPPPVDVIDATGRTIEATGPTVYADDDDVAALLELCKRFDHAQKEAFYTQAEEYSKRRKGASWSFRAEHRWTRNELKDCKAVVYALLEAEPWEIDDAPTVDPETGEVASLRAGPVTVEVLQAAMVTHGFTSAALLAWIDAEYDETPDVVDGEGWGEWVSAHPDRAARAVAWMDAETIRVRWEAEEGEEPDVE